MPRLRRTPLAARVYGAALWLCPPSFRSQFGDEMRRDFGEARIDAHASGRRRDVWRFGAQMTLDLARTAATEWVRTGAIAIAIAAMLCTLTLGAAFMNVLRQLRFDVPSHVENPDLAGLILIGSTTFLVIATTIIFTLWASRPIRRIGRPR